MTTDQPEANEPTAHLAPPASPATATTAAPARRSGQGKPGFCKICVFPGAQFLNARHAREGLNAKQAAEFAKTLDPSFGFTRQTWYAHVEHITHPLVTAADAARNAPVIVPKTNTGALEMIRDIGMKRAVEHPDEVTVDHAIKAASELNKREVGTDKVMVVLAKILSGEQPAEAIVGEWHEVPTELLEDTNGS